jgi:serine/threonine protein kinase
MAGNRAFFAPPDRLGHYAILGKIADGGMGTVVKARNDQNGEIVAIKLMFNELADNPVMHKRFEQEFRAASTIDHPNVVRALDYGEWDGAPYLVMEYVDGEPLSRLIDREGPLNETESIRLIAQVAQGLHSAHRHNLIHRDVKPDNILIAKDKKTGERIAKLTDLGLVKEQAADLDLTRTGRGLGTPHFMAPEQFKNAKNATIKCDIYSLGATLYAMLTKVTPFKVANPLDAWMRKIHNEFAPVRELNPLASERVEWAIRRSMSADPMLRPKGCREFIEDLTGRSTRKSQLQPTPVGEKETWYLSWKDENDEVHSVMGTLGAVRRSIKEGLLGDAANISDRKIRASRTKEGPFQALKDLPEFRDIALTWIRPTRESGAEREGQGAGNGSTLKSKPKKRKAPPGNISTKILVIGGIVLVGILVGAGGIWWIANG